MSSPQAVVEQICDAVALELNKTTTFAQTVRAVRQNLPRFNRADLANLQVVVAPRKRTNTLLTRGRTPYKQLDYLIGIGVYKGIAGYEETETDPLVLLCEQIGEHFPNFLTSIDTGQVMTCVECQQGDDETPLFDVNKMDELFQFSALINLTFRGAR